MTVVIILFLIGLLLIWLWIPYSPLKKQYRKDIKLIKKSNIKNGERVLKKSDFMHLPTPIQKYIEYCGYIGTKQMSSLCMEYKNVDFMQGREGPSLKIDYTQYNFVSSPCRMAFIDSRMFGIPFEGYDTYQDGKGGMKGVIAKVITLFNQTGPEMDKACLVTFLAESLFIPSVLLENYISFEEIDAYHVRAAITYKEQTVSGIFSFNEKYEFTSFSTEDRAVVDKDGTIEMIPWTAACRDYRRFENGIKYPSGFSAIWKYPEGDFIYFDGLINRIQYD